MRAPIRQISCGVCAHYLAMVAMPLQFEEHLMRFAHDAFHQTKTTAQNAIMIAPYRKTAQPTPWS
jgi:hypothetical protein